MTKIFDPGSSSSLDDRIPATDPKQFRSGPVMPVSGNGLDCKSSGHKGLLVYRRAIDLAVAVVLLTEDFPRTVRFSLCDQMSRSAISVPSNIAEGYGRRTTGEFRHSLGIARGENNELEAQLEIASRLAFGSQEKLMRARDLNADVGRLLHRYIASIERKNA